VLHCWCVPPPVNLHSLQDLSIRDRGAGHPAFLCPSSCATLLNLFQWDLLRLNPANGRVTMTPSCLLYSVPPESLSDYTDTDDDDDEEDDEESDDASRPPRSSDEEGDSDGDDSEYDVDEEEYE
jgi:hypothetical protein